MSRIAVSGSSASTAARACSFSASTLLGSPASTASSSARALGGVAGRGQHLARAPPAGRGWRRRARRPRGACAAPRSPRRGGPAAKSSPACARWNGRGSAAPAMRAASSCCAASGPRTSSRNCASVSAGCGSAGVAVGGRAQHRLGPVGVAGAHVPLDQRLAAPRGRPGRARPSASAPRRCRPGRRAPRARRAAPGAGPGRPGRRREGGVGQRQRLLRRAGVQPVGDQHHLGREVVAAPRRAPRGRSRPRWRGCRGGGSRRSP